VSTLHAVVIGHTDLTIDTVALCAGCKWVAGSLIDGPHVRALAVAHAQLEGHGVEVSEVTRTRTEIRPTS